jgi:hypothetical protein
MKNIHSEVPIRRSSLFIGVIVIVSAVLSCNSPVTGAPGSDPAGGATYSVAFDPDGGNPPTPSTKAVTYGEAYGSLPTTTRAGYIFDSWWTEAGRTGTRVTSATTMTTESDHTLFAGWIVDIEATLGLTRVESPVPRWYYQYGYGVAIDGDYAIVGEHRADFDSKIEAGIAHIYHRGADGSWGPPTTITAPDPGHDDQFGHSVDIRGDYAIVGAYGDDDGAAYVFRRTGTNEWNDVTKIEAPDSAFLNFGRSVAIDGNYAVVAAPVDDETPDETGAVFVYSRFDENGWEEQAKLVAPDEQSGDRFAGTWESLAIDGDYVIVGARREGGLRRGAAYVFRRVFEDFWDEGTKLVAEDGSRDDSFGWSVDIDGKYAIVHSFGADIDGLTNAGAVYVFRRTGSNSWDSGTKLVAPDAREYLRFGYSVAKNGDRLLIGSYEGAYLFVRSGDNSWDFSDKALWNEDDRGLFGSAVAISGSLGIIGDHADSGAADNAGAAYFVTIE